MLHKSYQTEILPNLSNAALLGTLWVTRVFKKGGLCNMLGIPVFNVKRWPPCLRRPARRTCLREAASAKAGKFFGRRERLRAGRWKALPAFLSAGLCDFFATLGFIFNSSIYVV
jgi:hypothetical protein